MKLQLSLERLKEVLIYLPESGEFYWRIAKGNVPAAEQEFGQFARFK